MSSIVVSSTTPFPSAVAHLYPQDTIGSLMEEPVAVFSPAATVAEAIEEVRALSRVRFFTYGYICQPGGRLVGVVTMRDLLLAPHDRTVESIMLRDPFSLLPEMPLLDAMKLTVNRHYPSYPVCEADGRLVGIVRGATLFERQAFEISAQAGSMVGVEKEERISTPWWKCLLFRHPWLQLNLLTAFIAAAVVGFFDDTIQKIVVLAVFLPVLAGQSGNTGCQALAVALRGMTLGELAVGKGTGLIMKEALLGLVNGVLVGLTAGGGMVLYAYRQHTEQSPWALGAIVFVAMSAACTASGVAGVITPLTLRKLGADPATASSIFLTTATDVASMGCFLALATLFLR